MTETDKLSDLVPESTEPTPVSRRHRAAVFVRSKIQSLTAKFHSTPAPAEGEPGAVAATESEAIAEEEPAATEEATSSQK